MIKRKIFPHSFTYVAILSQGYHSVENCYRVVSLNKNNVTRIGIVLYKINLEQNHCQGRNNSIPLKKGRVHTVNKTETLERRIIQRKKI